jgi:hypothetical protein
VSGQVVQSTVVHKAGTTPLEGKDGFAQHLVRAE